MTERFNYSIYSSDKGALLSTVKNNKEPKIRIIKPPKVDLNWLKRRTGRRITISGKK